LVQETGRSCTILRISKRGSLVFSSKKREPSERKGVGEIKREARKERGVSEFTNEKGLGPFPADFHSLAEGEKGGGKLQNGSGEGSRTLTKRG